MTARTSPLRTASPSEIGSSAMTPALCAVVSTTPVGKKVRLTLLRDGRETEVEVTVGNYQERESSRPERPRRPARPDEPKPDAPKE